MRDDMLLHLSSTSAGIRRHRNVGRWLAAVALICAPVSADAQAPSASPAAPKVTIVHAGTLLATPGERPRERQSVIITNDRITGIEDGFVSRPGATVIDLSRSFVLPGLIDSHVHLQFGSKNFNSDLVTMEDGAELLRGYSEAMKTLRAGFTTIRDMAGKPAVIFSLRDAINRGVVQGPRIIAAGPAIEPTGGGIIRGYRRDIAALLADSNLEVACDGVEDCTRITRKVIKDGADLVKIVVTGSILSPSSAQSQQMTTPEVDAIVEAARGMGKKVSAHAHGLPGVNAAIEAGVQSIEHGSFADQSSIALMRKSGAYLVPTMTSLKVLRERVQDPSADPVVRANVLAAYDRIVQMVGLAYKAKVKIAFGTDSNVGLSGTNAGEFRLLKQAGLSEVDMIRAATVVAAGLLGIEAEVGSLTPGKVADVIAVDGNPLEDITLLENVKFVMSRGAVIE